MSSIRGFKSFLILCEELNRQQKEAVRSWLPFSLDNNIQSNEAVKLSKHIIPPGEHHIVIPATPTIMNRVREHLQNNGHEIHDYEKGVAKDRYGREINIGKALTKTKAPQDLIDSYASDDRKAAADMDNHEIVISRHPYHVAEGSTNKPWKSCAGLNTTGGPCELGAGEAARKLPSEIREGTHVAYLVPKGHIDIQSAIDEAKSRIYLKPHVSRTSGHKVLVPENKVYSDSQGTGKNQGFLDSVKEFTDEHFPMNYGELYYKHPDVYDDDDSARNAKINTSKKAIQEIFGNLNPNNINYPSILKDVNTAAAKNIDTLIQNPKNHDNLINLLPDKLNSNHIDEMIKNPDVHSKLITKVPEKLSSNHIDILSKNPKVYDELSSNLSDKMNEKHVDNIVNNYKDNLPPRFLSKFSDKITPEHIDKIIKDPSNHSDLIFGVGSKLNSNHIDEILKNPSVVNHPDIIHDLIKNAKNGINQNHIDKLISRHSLHNDLIDHVGDKLTPSHIETMIKGNVPSIKSKLIDRGLYTEPKENQPEEPEIPKEPEVSNALQTHSNTLRPPQTTINNYGFKYKIQKYFQNMRNRPRQQ